MALEHIPTDPLVGFDGPRRHSPHQQGHVFCADAVSGALHTEHGLEPLQPDGRSCGAIPTWCNMTQDERTALIAENRPAWRVQGDAWLQDQAK